MPDSRRLRVPGGCFFFTVNLLERRGNALLTDRIDHLRDAVRHVRRTRPFAIDAFVVLPDHMHAVWTLPPDDDDFSTRWRLIKTFFARGVAATERRSRVRRADRERGIWQRRFSGARHPRRRGLRCPCRLRAFQPGQARFGRGGGGLAVLHLQGVRRTRVVPGDLGRRWGSGRGGG